MPWTERLSAGALVVALFLTISVAAAAATSREIAYCYQPLVEGGLRQIYVINSDGTGNRKLITADIGLNHHSWSPDGERLAAVGYVDGVPGTQYSSRGLGTPPLRAEDASGRLLKLHEERLTPERSPVRACFLNSVSESSS